MQILHTAYCDSFFYIWGEHSYRLNDLKVSPGQGKSTHPFAMSIDELTDLIDRTGIELSDKSRAASCSVKLPSVNGIPIPSSPLLGDIPESDTVDDPRYFSISAVSVPYDFFVKLTEFRRQSGGEKLSLPGVLSANDTLYILLALQYAAILATRGDFIPDMTRGDNGCVSLWTPLFLPKYKDEYASYTQALPPILKGFRAHGVTASEEQEELSLEILGTMLDDIVRDAQNKGAHGRHVNPDNYHEMWIRSLTWQKATLPMWEDEMRAAYPAIKEWATEAKVGSDEPWRVMLRLGEPEDKEKLEEWPLSWHLQSIHDPTVIIPASRVWSPNSAERKWFATVNSNPRRFMLQSLGKIASYIPAVADALEEQYPVSCTLSTQELFDFLSVHLPKITDAGIAVQYPVAWGKPEDMPKLSVSGSINDSASFAKATQFSLEDLLQVDWTVSLGGDVLTQEEIDMLAELKSPLVNIRGRWVLMSPDEVEEILGGLKKLPKDISRRSALLASLNGNFGGMEISQISDSEWLDSVRAVLTGKKQPEEKQQPENFSGTLRPYQKRGYSWMLWLAKLGLGGCLADDMGLGKTVQTLALLQKIHDDGEKRPVLLACPTSVIENWRREAGKFVPDLKTVVHHGTDRLRGEKFVRRMSKSNIVITSYALMNRDSAAISKVKWAGIILDEAQNIKNPDSRQSKAARSVAADWHIALTGTPIENHVGDLWSIMEFTVPGLMPSRAKFAREYLRPIQEGNTSAMEKLKLMTAPFILRRLKTDKDIISDLPQKIETEVFCPLSTEQATLYSAVLKRLDEKISTAEGIKRKGLVIATITALKQICDHPALFMKDSRIGASRSGKLTRLADIAEEMLGVGDRALIFTQYAAMGEILKDFLQETFGRETLFLHGGVTREKRDEMVRRFQQSKDAPPFFVLSLKAGGTGLNLTGANHVILFDRWWNPAVEQQAVDRAYRIGQTNNVLVHYFCCKGTLEEKIEDFITSKRRLAETIITSGENWLTELSDADLHELFSLNRDTSEDD